MSARRRRALPRAALLAAAALLGADSGTVRASETAAVPDWARDAVWYQVFPERFRNGDPANDPRPEWIGEAAPGWRIRPWGSDWYAPDAWERDRNVFQTIFRRRYGGDLRGVLDRIGYIQDLGATAIYLNPVFRAPSLHKYDGACLHHVDESFGPDPEGDRRMIEAAAETEDPATWVWTSADRLLLDLVREAHRRGMRVILDGVFNHTGRSHFAFRDLLRSGPASRYASWYTIDRFDTALPDGFAYRGWFGVRDLPEVRRDGDGLDAGWTRYVFDSTRRWMAPDGRVADGIDGWRLDVAFCVPHGFWKAWRAHVKSINSEAYLTAEIIEPAPEYVRGDEFDALMNYPFAVAATEFLIDRAKKIPPTVFDRRLRDLREAYPEGPTHVAQNLLSSHDTPRLRTLVVNPDMDYRDWGRHFERSKVERNPDYRLDRGGPEADATHRLVAALQFTYVGAPMVYYGDEVGMTGANDPDCRKPMLWDDLAYEAERAHPHPGRTRPAEENRPDTSLRAHYRRLAAIRAAHPALRRGTFETLLADDATGVYAFLRAYVRDRVVVVLNSGAEAREAEIPVPPSAGLADGAHLADLLGGGAVRVENGRIRLTMPPRAAAILAPADGTP